MAIRMTKAWTALDPANATALTGHLGVYELADEHGEIVFIGVAGGRSRFGLRGELEGHAANPPAGATRFRVEVNMAYRTRHAELLELFLADHGRVPSGQPDLDPSTLGRLRPD